MSAFSLYLRVLGQLRPKAKLACILVFVNLVLAGAQFAKPIQLGRIIGQMSAASGDGRLESKPFA
jgi:ATP-binding cassette subfamily B protein